MYENDITHFKNFKTENIHCTIFNWNTIKIDWTSIFIIYWDPKNCEIEKRHFLSVFDVDIKQIVD